MLRKKIHKDKYPLLVAITFFIYICATAFIFIFSSKVGAVMENNGKTLDSLPGVTTLDLQKDFTTVEMNNENIYTGPLVLVNNHYECKFDGDNLVSVLEESSQKYKVSDFEVKVNKSIMGSLNDMLSDFYDITGNRNTLVCSAYRSKSLQEELYAEDKEEKGEEYQGDEMVAVPGYSEHQTGYAVDFSILDNDGNMYEFDNEGDYKWILDNCANYGFILRYPEDKVALTEIGYETWHYRYVGLPHSLYIMQNNLCLEEYTTLVKEHPVSNPLYVTDMSLVNWMIYYVPAESGNTTSLQVPTVKNYQVFGNNVDGFVVSVKMN